MPYCHGCGKEVGEDASFCPYCGVPLREEARRGELLTEEIMVPYPDSQDLSLEIVIGAPGRVQVGGGAEEGFIEGTIEYDIPEWKPRVQVSDGAVRISQAERWDEKRWRFHDIINRWDMRLGDSRPFRMSVKTGVSRGEWNLGRLPITDLRAETGVSENRIKFDGHNPETMGRLKLSSGVGNVRVEGLLDANFMEMEVGGGVGDVTLWFTGEKLRQEASVKVEGGVGSLKIIVDERTPTRATVRGMTSVGAHGSFRRVRRGQLFGGEYSNRAYEEASGPCLEFNITMGVGSVTLDTC